MKAESQHPKGREGAIEALNEAIEGLNLVKVSCIAPAKTVVDSVSTLLTLIRVRFPSFCQNLLQVYT